MTTVSRKPETTSRRKRGPEGLERLDEAQRAVLRYWLGKDGRAEQRLAAFSGSSRSHAVNVLSGKRGLPAGVTFDALAGALHGSPVLPALLPAAPLVPRPFAPLSPALIDEWKHDERDRRYFLSSSSPNDSPTFHGRLDHLVLAADLRAGGELFEVIPELLEASTRTQEMLLDDGRRFTLRFEHEPLKRRTSGKRFHHAFRYGVDVLAHVPAARLEGRKSNGQSRTKKVRDDESVRVAPALLAKLHVSAFRRRCSRHRGSTLRDDDCSDCDRTSRAQKSIRVEFTGEAFSNDLVLALARRLFLPVVVPGSVEIHGLHVPLDVANDPASIILLHDPARTGSALRAPSAIVRPQRFQQTLSSRGRAVVLYDKLLDLLERGRTWPPHSAGTQHLARVEARVNLRARGVFGTVENALREVRALLADVRLADLARHPAPGTTNWMLDLARRSGISSRAATLRELLLLKKSAPDEPAQRHGLQRVVFDELRGRGLSDERAYEDSALIHAWTLQRVRDLAARTPWSLAEMFDLHAATTIEPLLRALVDAPRGRYAGLARVPNEVA